MTTRGNWRVCPQLPELRIMVRGRLISFEMHPYCGPLPMSSKTGYGIDLVPSHPFWDAVTRWSQLGGLVGNDGICLDHAPVLQPTPEARGL